MLVYLKSRFVVNTIFSKLEVSLQTGLSEDQTLSITRLILQFWVLTRKSEMSEAFHYPVLGKRKQNFVGPVSAMGPNKEL